MFLFGTAQDDDLIGKDISSRSDGILMNDGFPGIVFDPADILQTQRIPLVEICMAVKSTV